MSRSWLVAVRKARWVHSRVAGPPAPKRRNSSWGRKAVLSGCYPSLHAAQRQCDRCMCPAASSLRLARMLSSPRSGRALALSSFCTGLAGSTMNRRAGPRCSDSGSSSSTRSACTDRGSFALAISVSHRCHSASSISGSKSKPRGTRSPSMGPPDGGGARHPLGERLRSACPAAGPAPAALQPEPLARHSLARARPRPRPL
mmetsp:Transcript_112943/g.319557  ORF Transcript_112943/g.319557 Transcript_112943/m.319557 type:complete len:201 (-) Transcript_112943:138-740(-)